ncbi:MAG: NEW3 domain-containing protein, partial [Chitinophagaceae bacterium]|nr:NEW3 domain-containing protein [Chitinophagaceae bacterium]
NETEQLNNLANYLTVLQAANKMGALSAEIEAEGWVNLLELIQFAIEQLALGQSLKDYVPADKNPLFESGLTEEGLKIIVGNLKILKEGTTVTLKKVVSKYPGNAEVKKNLEVALTIVSDAIDILINLVESGKNRAVFETLFAQLKKLLAQQLVAVSHEEFYLKQRHSNLVPLTSNQSLQKVSDLDFSTVFDNVYRPGGESLVGVAQNQLDEKKKQIETAVSISNVAGSAADISEAASALALIPGGQVAGGIFRSLAYGAKLVKGSALLTGTSIGLLGSSEIRDSSLKIRPRAGFNNGGGGDGPVQAIMLGQSLLAHGVLSEADSITARTVRLNQHLAQLNVFYQSGTWQPVPFGNAYKAWRKADSLLGEAIYGGLLQIQPYLSEAFLNVNGFETFYNTTVDSFLDKRTHLNRALFYRSLAWMHVNNPATESAGLDSLVDELTALNDTLANRLAIIIGQIANSSVEGDAYLEKISWAYNHTHAPGSNGSVRFTFKNVGPVTMQNVRFLLDPLSGGYTLTSPDSVFAGNIAPGDTIQFTFQFTSPQTDSIGRYKVMVRANNGRTPEVSGSLIVVNPNKVFSIRDGNWSDASTWHNGMVPLPSNDVQVGHKVKANQNITCKSLTVTIYGDLQIDPGKTVIIQQ